jgi:hypothetical protein
MANWHIIQSQNHVKEIPSEPPEPEKKSARKGVKHEPKQEDRINTESDSNSTDGT